MEHLGEQDRVEGCDLGRLQHHGATGGDCRGDLAGDLVERPVPGRDHSDDAGRFLDEQEVLVLIHQGLANKEIAERMSVAPATVKAHIRNLYGKLGVSRRTEALAKAREVGLLEDVAKT